MDLILWRHAEAEDGVPDSARELTGRGQKQARAIAAWLKKRLPTDHTILVSPSKRTRQTADALGLPYESTKNVGTGATADDVLSAAGWPTRDGAILVVGHQPTLGDAAARILSVHGDAGLTIKKGALWWFSCRSRDGGDVLLRAVIGPDLA